MTADELESAILASALSRRRGEVEAALVAAGGTWVVPRDRLPPGADAQWLARARRIEMADDLDSWTPQAVASLFAHEAAHRALHSVWWLPALGGHTPAFAGLAFGLARRWTGCYAGWWEYDFGDRPFLMSPRRALLIARRCAVRAQRMPIDAAVRACWRDILLVKGLWFAGEVLERHAGRLLFLSACLTAAALCFPFAGLSAAVSIVFSSLAIEQAMPARWLDFQIQLNRRRKQDV